MYSVLLHTPAADLIKHVHTIHAVDVLETYLQTVPKAMYSLKKKNC